MAKEAAQVVREVRTLAETVQRLEEEIVTANKAFLSSVNKLLNVQTRTECTQRQLAMQQSGVLSRFDGLLPRLDLCHAQAAERCFAECSAQWNTTMRLVQRTIIACSKALDIFVEGGKNGCLDVATATTHTTSTAAPAFIVLALEEVRGDLLEMECTNEPLWREIVSSCHSQAALESAKRSWQSTITPRSKQALSRWLWAT
eukprot:m.26537 g.26537  ORF g.26537 m.26537 type:complete len:201 (+) comp8838_c0_seq2:258-860(+)